MIFVHLRAFCYGETGRTVCAKSTFINGLFSINPSDDAYDVDEFPDQTAELAQLGVSSGLRKQPLVLVVASSTEEKISYLRHLVDNPHFLAKP